MKRGTEAAAAAAAVAVAAAAVAVAAAVPCQLMRRQRWRSFRGCRPTWWRCCRMNISVTTWSRPPRRLAGAIRSCASTLRVVASEPSAAQRPADSSLSRILHAERRAIKHQLACCCGMRVSRRLPRWAAQVAASPTLASGVAASRVYVRASFHSVLFGDRAYRATVILVVSVT